MGGLIIISLLHISHTVAYSTLTKNIKKLVDIKAEDQVELFETRHI